MEHMVFKRTNFQEIWPNHAPKILLSDDPTLEVQLPVPLKVFVDLAR